METITPKKPIISIAGLLGSGKSSTAKAVAQDLGFTHFSSGDFMRATADKMNMSLVELSILAEENLKKKDYSIDYLIDEQVKNIGERNNVVIDSRLAFHWIPESFKVFLTLDQSVAAARVLKDAQKNPDRNKEHAEQVTSVEDVIKSISRRLETEKKRYWEIYKINHVDTKNFDLVIDTSDIPVAGVVQKVLEEYKKWINS